MGTTIGLISSSIALVVGWFFLIYAVKYYVSIVIALIAASKNTLKNTKYRGKNEWNGSYPMISIHLPFYNEANVAKRILYACKEIDYPNFEVLVADDSRDRTIKILKDTTWNNFPPIIKRIHRGERTGFKGGALTEALRYMDSNADYVVVFDADFIPPKDILWRFLDHFNKNDSQNKEIKQKPIAAVQGYQLHYLNKSENWVTLGVRAEFSGSYMVERVAEEKLGAMKMISGSVFMLKADLLRRLKWTTSITEDWELTLRLYLEGYRVVYTPLIQAPAEIPTTISALAKQRMRWAEGHTYAVRRYFMRIINSHKLTIPEKLEFIYFAPYYLQSLLLLIGTFFWIIAEINHRHPWFWSSTMGWSLLSFNLLSAPIMSLVGLFLEKDLRKDYSGIFSLIALTYLLAPYQGFAAIKGLLEREEGTWIRTLKTGSITDKFFSVKLRRLLNLLTYKISIKRHTWSSTPLLNTHSMIQRLKIISILDSINMKLDIIR